MAEVMRLYLDLQTRRAMILGMGAEGHYQKITAKAPLAELYQYSSTLRSLSQGRAKFHQEFVEYSPVPHDIQQRLMEEYETEAAEADYGDAATLAETAEEYADKAIRLSREAHRGGGR